MKKTLLSTLLTMLVSISGNAQTCGDSTTIYAFTYNGTNYELIRENKTWVEAAACAVTRGGYLAEIDDMAEQNAVYNEIMNNGNVIASNTVAPDGGGASYIWIGGNDIANEGEWIWDGDNSGSGPQFWQGTTTGNPVGGLYNNWGNEPDNWNGQDGLGLAITDWPLGVSGQWNDVDDGNQLYYLVEIPSTIGLNETDENNFFVYPNPFVNTITIDNIELISSVKIMDANGKTLMELSEQEKLDPVLDLSILNKGVYILQLTTSSGIVITKELVK